MNLNNVNRKVFGSVNHPLQREAMVTESMCREEGMPLTGELTDK